MLADKIVSMNIQPSCWHVQEAENCEQASAIQDVKKDKTKKPQADRWCPWHLLQHQWRSERNLCWRTTSQLSFLFLPHRSNLRHVIHVAQKPLNLKYGTSFRPCETWHTKPSWRIMARVPSTCVSLQITSHARDNLVTLILYAEGGKSVNCSEVEHFLRWHH